MPKAESKPAKGEAVEAVTNDPSYISDRYQELKAQGLDLIKQRQEMISKAIAEKRKAQEALASTEVSEMDVAGMSFDKFRETIHAHDDAALALKHAQALEAAARDFFPMNEAQFDGWVNSVHHELDIIQDPDLVRIHEIQAELTAMRDKWGAMIKEVDSTVEKVQNGAYGRTQSSIGGGRRFSDGKDPSALPRAKYRRTEAWNTAASMVSMKRVKKDPSPFDRPEDWR